MSEIEQSIKELAERIHQQYPSLTNIEIVQVIEAVVRRMTLCPQG